MAVESGKYYYISREGLKSTGDLLEINPGVIFCYVSSNAFHFGKRHHENIATYLEEQKICEDLYEKLETLCQKYAL